MGTYKQLKEKTQWNPYLHVFGTTTPIFGWWLVAHVWPLQVLCVVSFPVLDVANTTRAAIPAIQTSLKFNCWKRHLRLTVCACYTHTHKPALLRTPGTEQSIWPNRSAMPNFCKYSNNSSSSKGVNLFLLLILHNSLTHFLVNLNWG